MSRPAQPELDQQEEETETQPEPAAISRKKERGTYDANPEHLQRSYPSKCRAVSIETPSVQS